MKVKVIYGKKPGYSPVYVNGAVGGFGPQGEVFINFFREETALEGNYESIDKLKMREPEGETDGATKVIVRNIETGVILNRDRAFAIYEWLGKMLNQNGN
jgi:hypothetical protein